MSTLPERFKAARKHAGLTQAQAAEKAQDAQQSYNQIEGGETKMPKKIEKYAADVFNVPVEWLAFGKGDPPSWFILDKNEVPKGYIPVLKWNEIEEWVENGIKNIGTQRKFLASPLIDMQHRNKLFSVAVENDTMVAASTNAISFIPGTILIGEPREKGKSGDYVIVKKRNNKEAFFRQIIKDGPDYLLKPLNPRYNLQKLTNDYYVIATVISRVDILI